VLARRSLSDECEESQADDAGSSPQDGDMMPWRFERENLLTIESQNLRTSEPPETIKRYSLPYRSLIRVPRRVDASLPLNA
jgi:hypothetical protein